MRKGPFKTFVFFFGLLAFSLEATADATLYRWKDAAGNPVVSDRPPSSGTEFETITTTSNLVRSLEDEPAPAPEPTPPKPVKKSDKPVSQKFRVSNPEYCEEAKNNLIVIDNAPRIRMQGENGELRYLTDEERAKQREDNLETIEAYCQ